MKGFTKKEKMEIWLERKLREHERLTDYHQNDVFLDFYDEFYKDASIITAQKSFRARLNNFASQGIVTRHTFGLGRGAYNIHGTSKETIWVLDKRFEIKQETQNELH